MTRLLRAELLKLGTTRLLIWLVLLTLGFETLVISLHVSQDAPTSLAEPHTQRNVVSVAALSALISVLLGIVASAGGGREEPASSTRATSR